MLLASSPSTRADAPQLVELRLDGLDRLGLGCGGRLGPLAASHQKQSYTPGHYDCD